MVSPYSDSSFGLSTRSHCGWLASGCTTVLISLSRSIYKGASSSDTIWLYLISSCLAAYVLADLASGIYHWAIDNYGSAETPFFGFQIESFQSHHKMPWEVTRTQMANNLHRPAQVITFILLPINLVYDDVLVLGFFGVFAGFSLFCQQFHAWAHCPKARVSPLVAVLQDIGVILPRSEHAEHHTPPYNTNYCIVNGMWNRVLDKTRVFVAIEVMLFYMLGVRPRSWNEFNTGLTGGEKFDS